MKTFKYTTTELAESFINGNISFVRKCLSNGKPKHTIAVRALIEEWQGVETVKRFDRLMSI